jgi:hypothetical protein
MTRPSGVGYLVVFVPVGGKGMMRGEELRRIATLIYGTHLPTAGPVAQRRVRLHRETIE